MTCSEAAWHGLWCAFHANPSTLNEIRVPLKPFEEVAGCHASLNLSFRVNSVVVRTPGVGAKKVMVRRQAFFEMLVAHGPLCDAVERNNLTAPR